MSPNNNMRSPADPLAAYERKLDVLRDLVRGVALNAKTGLYVYGSGGIGKSYATIRELEKLERPWSLFNSRMTAKGLFIALAAAPDAVLLLEDMERLTKDPDAQGVLRSALWAQPGHDRLVTWVTATGAARFVFRGGVIMLSNRPLADLPELRALATRIDVYRLEATDEEVVALMRHLAAKGYAPGGRECLDPECCLRVTEFLVRECRSARCPLDLRLQQKAFRTFLQWQADHTKNHWEDLVAVSVREAAAHFRHAADPSSPEERKAWRRGVLREILGRVPAAAVAEQVRQYVEQTSASRADFFRRKLEVESGEFDSERPAE